MHTLLTIIGLIAAPGLACFYIPYRILAATQIPLDRPIGLVQLIAILIGAIGVYMVIWVCVAFVRQGKGTPIPLDPPERLVVSGLYRTVRNPMYVGAVLIVLAEALYFGSLWLVLYAAGLWTILHTFMVVIEEPQLRRRFGAAYEQYLEEVPRWIPR